MPTVLDIENLLEEWAPKSLAEEWDNVGLQIGNPKAKVSKILIALDPAPPLLKKAREIGADLVITHHPMIFKPLYSLDLSQWIPSAVADFIHSGISLIAMHTNLDAAKGGVSDQLAAPLMFKTISPLLVRQADLQGTGIGRVGLLERPLRLEEIIRAYSTFLKPGLLTISGDPGKTVSKVAICGGSGSDLWPEVISSEADLFISAEIKHSILREAEALGRAVISAGHFQSEWPVVPAIANYLRTALEKSSWSVDITIFEEEAPPAWTAGTEQSE